MSESTLKPCPFCGGKAAAQVIGLGREFWVQCLGCAAKSDSSRLPYDAVENWNRRNAALGELVMPEPERTCATCRWFGRLSKEEATHGCCRFEAPRVFTHGGSFYSMQPETDPQWVCSHWEGK